jgi:hypothetical protein
MENQNLDIIPATSQEVTNFMDAVKVNMGDRAGELLNRDFNVIEKYFTKKDLYQLKQRLELKQFENVSIFYDKMYELLQGSILKHAALQRDKYLSSVGTQYEKEFIEYANGELIDLQNTLLDRIKNSAVQMKKDYAELDNFAGTPAYDFYKSSLDSFYKTISDNTNRLLEIFNERVKIKAESFRL